MVNMQRAIIELWMHARGCLAGCDESYTIWARFLKYLLEFNINLIYIVNNNNTMLSDKLSFPYRLSLLLKHIKCTLNLGLKTLLNRFFFWAPGRQEDSDEYLQDKFVAWSFDFNFLQIDN